MSFTKNSNGRVGTGRYNVVLHWPFLHSWVSTSGCYHHIELLFYHRFLRPDGSKRHPSGCRATQITQISENHRLRRLHRLVRTTDDSPLGRQIRLSGGNTQAPTAICLTRTPPSFLHDFNTTGFCPFVQTKSLPAPQGLAMFVNEDRPTPIRTADDEDDADVRM